MEPKSSTNTQNNQELAPKKVNTFEIVVFLKDFLQEFQIIDEMRDEMPDDQIIFFDDEEIFSDYLLKIQNQKITSIFLLISRSLAQELKDKYFHLEFIIEIFIYCRNEEFHINFIEYSRKVKVVTSKTNELIGSINTSKIAIKNNFSKCLRMQPVNSTYKFDSSQACQEYIIHQSLLRLLDDSDYKSYFNIERSKQEFFKICESEYSKFGSTEQDYLDMVTDFHADNFSVELVVKLYTKENFFYKMINYILRQNDIIKFFQIRYAIGLLHKSLKQIHDNSNPITLYRCAKISDDELQALNGILNKQKQILLQLRGFVSTTKKEEVAYTFGKLSCPPEEGLKSILYEIEVSDENVDKIFEISKFSVLKNEEEYLLSFNTCVILNNILISDNPNYDFKLQLSIVSTNKIDEFVDSEILNGTQLIREIKNINYNEDNFYLLHILQYCRMDDQMLQVINQTSVNDENSDIFYTFKGIIHQNKGEYEKSIEPLSLALQIRKSKLGRNHLDTAKSYENMGNTHKCIGNYEPALFCHKQALDIYKDKCGEDHVNTADSLINVAIIHSYKRDYDTACPIYQKALKIYETNSFFGKNPVDIAIIYENSAKMNYLKVDYKNAEEQYRTALQIFESNFGNDNIYCANPNSGLGKIFASKGNKDKAYEYHLKALEIRKKTLPENHPDLAFSYCDLGNVFERKGDHDKAYEFYLMALNIKETTLSEYHHDLVDLYSGLGKVFERKGDHDKAFEFHLKALKIKETNLKENHPDLAVSNYDLGRFLEKKGDYDKAYEFHLKALKIRETNLSKNNPDLGFLYYDLGIFLEKKGDHDKAFEFHLKALKIRETNLKENDTYLAYSYYNLGTFLERKGDNEKAYEYHMKALKIRETNLSENDLDLKRSQSAVEVCKKN